MVLTEVEDTSPYGVAALGRGDRIMQFVEKPSTSEAPSHWINAGVAVWAKDVLEEIPNGRPVSFEREVVPGLLPRGVYGFRSYGFWEDAGTPDRLLRAQRLLFDAGRAANQGVPSGAAGTGPVSAQKDVEAKGARFGRYVSVGSRVLIQPEALIDDSVLMDDVRVGRGARVVRSVLGPGVEVPAGSVVEDEVRASDDGTG